MLTNALRIVVSTLLLTIGALLSSLANAQHVHGVIELGVVVDGDTVVAELTAPLSDVIGFEYAPQDAAQQQRVEQAAAVLADADAMFSFPAAAGCEVERVTVAAPEFISQHLPKAVSKVTEHKAPGGHHHDDDRKETNGHHGHDEHENSDSHGHDDHEGHADHDESDHTEVVGSYGWRCENTTALTNAVLSFTKRFSGVETIELQVLTGAGARVQTLQGRPESISLLAQ